MFNLFGSLFFGRSNVETTTTTEPASVDNAPTISMVDNLLQLNSNETSDAFTQTSSTGLVTMTTQTTTTTSDIVVPGVTDWVIVEKTTASSVAPITTTTTSVCTSTVGLGSLDEAAHPRDTNMVCETSTFKTCELKEEEQAEQDVHGDNNDQDDDDVLLGSFFDRNLIEITSKQPPVSRGEDWLITPLPCLTSITAGGAQQRCMLESDPLENLLIEHPSMSVFVTVASGSSLPVADNEDDDDTASCASELPLCIIMQSDDDNNNKKTATATATPSAQKKRKQPATLGEHQSQQSSASASGENSPTSTIKRKGKKNKTSVCGGAVSVVGNNKENVQARALLMSELRKQTSVGKLDAIILNKNQMKRNNKLNANKFNTVNCVQRKFHQLQQPAF